MRSILTLILFVVGVLGCGSAIGILITPGEWYAGLEKPPFNPPNWIFAPAWTTLYIMIGVAGWRLWERARQSDAMKLWFAQLPINFIWTPAFFGAHMIVVSLGIIAFLLLMIVVFIREARKVDRVASALFVPYAAWVTFATLLNASLVYLND
ncbi:TspO/MBR family protein [Amaricoccus macauensis]|uniref:TspO/MBR family protein n=1 Tax=Amaricoccus macauensis TaxID=57001 RepID=UPI003C7E6E88